MLGFRPASSLIERVVFDEQAETMSVWLKPGAVAAKPSILHGTTPFSVSTTITYISNSLS